MAITGLKQWSTGDALNEANLNNDKGILEAKFSGGIVNADISTAAAIDTSKLSARNYELVLKLRVDGVAWAAAAALGSPTYVAVAHLPADVDAEQYTILGATYTAFSTAGITAGQAAQIDWGYFGGTSSAFTVTSTPVTSANFTTPVVNANQGLTVGLTLSVTSIQLSTTNRHCFALKLVTDAGGFTTAAEFIEVSIKLKRTSGLRS